MYTSAAQYEANQVALVGDDGVLLVDAGWTETAPTLKDRMRQDGLGNVRILISTHSHDDHTSGNRSFRNDAVVFAHRNACDQISNRYFSLPPLGSLDAPNVMVDDSLTLRFNGEDIRLTLVPGCHTSGDLIVHFVTSNIVCVGDLLFPDHFPYIDLSIGGNVENYYSNIKRLITAYPPETRFVSGHGRVYSVSELAVYFEELEKQRAVVRQAMAAGKTLDVIQNDSVLNPWLAWSGPWVTTDANYWIATLHHSLSDTTSTPKISVCAPFTETLMQSGIAAALAKYRSLKETQSRAYSFSENEINNLGYQLLSRQMNTEAVEVFELNTKEYPNSANVFDSYGEALLVVGDTAKSVANYKRSLELNPNNTNATQVLRTLQVR